ncbi:MAG: hypothetical protein JST43_13810 [Bacteroidetes bacterium]|nr:hypothetical protein [Bacteroidota bacterium]MBS1539751.1 hypothetical protein [Bacteroidota bacterium]
MLKTKVKVSNVTNLSDARYCAGMGVDYLSFPVPQVNPQTYREITAWVAGPKFGIETCGPYSDLLNEYEVDFIEIAASEILLAPPQREIIVQLSVEDWLQHKAAIRQLKNEKVIVEFAVRVIDDQSIQSIQEAATKMEVLIKTDESIPLRQLLELPVAGISLEGNPEPKPGLKEYPLALILEQLELD